MKKILIPLLLVILILLTIPKDKKDKTNEEEFRGVFVSYIEISKYLKGKEDESVKQNINKIIENVKDSKLNTIILQVRPSADAIYISKIFSISNYLTDEENYSFDVLEHFINISHQNNIKLYAWINPYRVSTTTYISEYKTNKLKEQEVYDDISYINGGIYFNPSKEDVEKLIIKGVKEVLEYNVDGILFDDYFYPNDNIDIEQYNVYRKDSDISLEEYHLEIVNSLVKKVHTICKEKNVPFGVSPEGNIENNYNNNYADVRRWLKEDKYVDFIMPQLYYGFFNSTKPYINTLDDWVSIIENKDIKLIPALALYKSNKDDYYAKDGSKEWIENKNIIMREILISRNREGYKGFSLYRYDNLLDDGKEELINAKKMLN